MDCTFIDHFYTIIERLRRTMMTQPHSENMTKQEFFTMQVIGWLEEHHKKATTARLSQELTVSKSAVSQTVNSLESKGFVRRKLEATDRRQPSVHLTDQGQQALLQEKDTLYHQLFSIFGQMGEEKSRLFLDLLQDFTLLSEQFFQEEKKSQALGS